MSTYYQYQDVGVMIAHKLMNMDGWKVYGYHADESDSMTDYYSPAYWNGVAEKNGYILCVNVYGAAEQQEIREYNYTNFSYNADIQEKIKKLEQMTVERGASEQEEQSAKMMIEKLQKKAAEETENNNKYIVTGYIPAHQAHPPKCNWHIEKDGVIVAKGNGILKYSSIDNYYKYPRYMEDMNKYKKDKKAYTEYYINHLMNERYYSDREKAEKVAQSHIEDLEKDIKLIKQFDEFINKIDTTCGGILGEGDLVTYEKVIKTEYKTENKAVETTNGSIKEGQCFILKTNFNYGCYKGLVYRIHEVEENGKKYYHAYKLNGKLTKECTGKASQNNYWFIGSGGHDNITKWINKGSISWCNIEEVKTPYEVEKVVKKVIKAENNQTKKETNTTTETTPEQTELNNLHYEIKADIDTRDNTQIYVVKVIEKLSKDEYIKVNKNMKSLGGYYSKFKHGFIFKDDPTELLTDKKSNTTPDEEKAAIIEDISNISNNGQIEQSEQPKPSIEFEIEQSEHTQTKQPIWLVKIKNPLSKTEFAEVKQNFATLKGFYSSFTNSFIFKYDPTEKIRSTA